MTTQTPRTDAAVAFVWGQVKDEAVDDLPRYTIETLGATMRDLERDLAAALERAKSAGEDAFKLRVDLAAAQEELERVRDKCNEHYMALAAAQEANAKLKAERDRIKAHAEAMYQSFDECPEGMDVDAGPFIAYRRDFPKDAP